MPVTALGSVFKFAFELSPIFLTGNSQLINGIPGGVLPILLLTEPLNAVSDFLNENVELDRFFAHFVPMPGATLVENQISQYPFANRAIAANALIAQPLQISMRMICPVQGAVGYAIKTATMIALQGALAMHNSTGGTYTVATPSMFYTNCIMTAMRDISGGESHQAQHTWQMDFMRPLLTIDDAGTAMNPLMNLLSNGGQVNSASWSGPAVNVGQTSPSLTFAAGMQGSGSASVQPVTATPLPPLP